MLRNRTLESGALNAGRLLAVVLVAGLLACGQSDPETAEPTEAEIAAAAARAAEKEAKAVAKVRAKEIFETRCTDCHGSNGAGNGPQSDELSPRPRNFQDPGWQKSVTDEYLAQIIVEGGEAVGRAAVMPPNPDLVGEDATVDALVRYMRSLAH